MNKDINTNHTFAICAYKESPYLEECIQSLMNQTVKSDILIHQVSILMILQQNII